MRYLMTSVPAEESANTLPDPKMMAEMGQFIEEMMRSGVLIATGGLLPISMGGAYIKSKGGKIVVTDGPFTEAKELVAGFALVECKSREEAIELSKRFWSIAGDGEGEIRQIAEPGSQPGS